MAFANGKDHDALTTENNIYTLGIDKAAESCTLFYRPFVVWVCNKNH